jgi:hypothetical protein
MATSKFSTLRLKKEDIAKLLDGGMKGFNRLAIQFYRRRDDKFTLVAMLLDERRRKLDKSPVIFIDEVSGDTTYETDGDVMFLQHELTKSQIMRLSDHGKNDIILTPKKIEINPEGVTYDPLNPCPPADPPPEP